MSRYEYVPYYSLEPYTTCERTVIIKLCVDMSKRMWLVPVSSSLDNRDKTILKKLTLIQDLQYNCHKNNIM